MLGIGQIGSAIGRIGATAPIKGGGGGPAPVLGPYLPATNLAAAYGAARVVEGYSGPLYRLVRASDSATLDVSCASGSDDPDYAAIDTWIGASSATVDIVYDQTGGGKNLTQTTANARPRHTSLYTMGGVRPFQFVDRVADTIRSLVIPASLSVSRNNFTYVSAISNVSSWSGVLANENYGNCVLEFLSAGTSGSTQFALFHNDGSVWRNNITGSAASTTIRSRAEPLFLAASSGGTGVDFYLSEEKSTVAAASALTMNAGGSIGRSNAASNFGFRGEMAAMAFYSASLNETSIGSIRDALGERFSLNPALPKRLVYGGSSLIFAKGTTGNRTPPRLMDLPGIEVMNVGISGLTLATEYSARASRDYVFFGTGKENVLVTDAPSNDINTLTPADQAAAETSATNIYNNTLLPFVNDAKNVKGFSAVVVPTTIARGSMTLANFKEYARLKYNQLVVDGAAANGYIASDRCSDARLGATGASSDTTYFDADAIHLNDAGTAILAAIDEAAIYDAFGIELAMSMMVSGQNFDGDGTFSGEEIIVSGQEVQ